MGFADLVAAADRVVQGNLGAVTITYRSEFVDSVEIPAMFDERYVFIDEGEAGVEQTTPAVFLRLEDLPANPNDENPIITITVHGLATDYVIRERQPDGMGGIRLLLHLADCC